MSTPTRTRRRAGMTLVELLIALVLFGIVGGAVMTVVIRQQRVSTRASGLVDTRDQSRVAFATLAAELKGLSSAGGDIDPTDWTATSMRIRAAVGTSVVCGFQAGRFVIDLPTTDEVNPPGAGPNVTLTSFVNPSAPVAVDDTVWVLDPTMNAANPWRAFRVLGGGTQVNVCSNTLMDAAVDVPKPSLALLLDAAVPASVPIGAPIRITRASRYSFQADADGRSYLMYQPCSGGACGAAQPVAGPFLPATANATTTGFRFTYFDSTGAVAATATAVSRIGIYLRTASVEQLSSGGSSRTQYVQTDSLIVALRNRR